MPRSSLRAHVAVARSRRQALLARHGRRLKGAERRQHLPKPRESERKPLLGIAVVTPRVIIGTLIIIIIIIIIIIVVVSPLLLDLKLLKR